MLLPAAQAAGTSPVLSHFRLEDGRLFLPGVRLAGMEIRTVFDTGARASSISETLAARAGLAEAGRVSVNTLSGRLRQPWVRTAIALSGGRIEPRRTLVMPDAMQDGIDCVLGGGDLDGFALSFLHGELQSARREAFPLALETHRRSLPTITLRNQTRDLSVVIDSGARACVISRDAAVALMTAPASTALFYDTPQGNELRALRVDAFRSGDALFRQTLFRVRRDLFGGSGRRGRDGVLGTDFLQGFDWNFETGGGISVEEGRPNAQTWIGVGLDFRSDAEDPGRIIGLARNGPAAAAGLRLGDRIRTMNGVLPDDIDGLAVIGACQCAETVEIAYERDGVPATVRPVAAPLI